MKTSDLTKAWVSHGYSIFAYEGPTGLKIERLAKLVGKNKSSFYHLFADLEVFTNVLLNHHLEQARILAQKESECPGQKELVEIIVAHKLDLLFNRQLRIHRENKEFETYFTKITQFSVPSILPVWQHIIGLQENSYLARLVLQLTLENFFLQITDETLNTAWLNGYFDNIRTLVKQFKNTKSVASLDGTV
ncbi:TetR/AcrR family transcriptional regulator [Aggregatimonas sangjinii]|uniref:TetR/AcrR family transcriptional regulator n=1 Tax=Aggregatimonas sangjinii TaxID=2583587 RepID=A0A5B7SUC3_9FLAO|nr:TetR/AcrR family transcriptional regulator [Aggregatimonas sangjinii]QCX00461.1 TetR/AcrR family transcriptional regulator [Aggregatimonas sangjinii]